MKLQSKIFFVGLLILIGDFFASSSTAQGPEPVKVVDPAKNNAPRSIIYDFSKKFVNPESVKAYESQRALENEQKAQFVSESAKKAQQHKMPEALQAQLNQVDPIKAMTDRRSQAVAERQLKVQENSQKSQATQANKPYFNYVKNQDGALVPVQGPATKEGVAPIFLDLSSLSQVDPAKSVAIAGVDVKKLDQSNQNDVNNFKNISSQVKGPKQNQKSYLVDPIENYNRSTMSAPMEQYIAPLQAKYPNATSEQLQEYVTLVLAKEQSGQPPTGFQLLMRKRDNPYPILEPKAVAEYNPRWPEKNSEGDLRSTPTSLQQLYKDLNESNNKSVVRSAQSNGAKEFRLSEKASGAAVDKSSSQSSVKVAEQQPQVVDLNHAKVDTFHTSHAAVPVVLPVVQNPIAGSDNSFKSFLTLPKIDDTAGAVENLYNAIDARPVVKKGWIYGTTTTSVTAEQISGQKNNAVAIKRSYENIYKNQETAFIALNKDIIALEEKITGTQDQIMKVSLEKLKTNATVASDNMNQEIVAAKVQDLLSQLLPASQEISIEKALDDFGNDRAKINNQIKLLDQTDPVAIKIDAQYKAVYSKAQNLLETIEKTVENFNLQLINLTPDQAKTKINKELKPSADKELDKAKRKNSGDQNEANQNQYFLANQEVEQLKLILKSKGQDIQALKGVKVKADAIATNLIKDELIKHNKKTDIHLDPFKIGIPILIDKLATDKVVQGQENLQQEKIREFLKEYEANSNYNIEDAFEKLNELAREQEFKNSENEQFAKTLQLYTQVINELYLKIVKHENNKKVVEKYIQGLEKNKLRLSKNMQNVQSIIAELEKIPEDNRKQPIEKSQLEQFNKFVDIKKISEKTTVAELLELYEGVRDKLLEEHNKTSLQTLFNKFSLAYDSIFEKEYKTAAKAAGIGLLKAPGATVEVVGALTGHVVDAFKIVGLDWDTLPSELKVTITLTLITTVAGYFGIIQAHNNMNPDEKKKMQQDLLTAFAQDVATTAIAYKTGANYDAVASGDLTLIGTSAAINKLVPSDPNYRATNTVSTTNLDNFKTKYANVLNSSTYQPPVYGNTGLNSGNVPGSTYSNSYRPGAYAAA